MCGLVGFINYSRRFSEIELEMHISNMTRTLQHRGPDHGEIWVDAEAGISLGHRRLSIIDLSPTGNQPMFSANGRYVIVLNGEIFNFTDLREDLLAAGKKFHGHSDTEVLLEACAHWGVEGALTRVNGMFAFALWDRLERMLYLARDRLGEKPLYYGWTKHCLLFGSELKAFVPHFEFNPEIRPEAVAWYTKYNCVPSPHTIYQGFKKLPPGTYIKFSSMKFGVTPEPVPYWSLEHIIEYGYQNNAKMTEIQALSGLEEILTDAVRIRTIADVPLGGLLSGGIDSSLVMALIRQCQTGVIRTYTIGFREKAFDEAAFSRRIAAHLGTEHSELYVTPEDALEVIPKLPEIYDEPFADSSQIPTYLVSGLTRKHVTVALSGDGGDELFGGYNRHFWLPWLVGRKRITKSILKFVIEAFNAKQWDGLISHLGYAAPKTLRVGDVVDKLHKVAGILSLENREQIYDSLISIWSDEDGILVNMRKSAIQSNIKLPKIISNEFPHMMMYLDTIGYLPNDILTKVDRASMAAGLEVRSPYLDHRVVEYVWKLPLHMKIHRTTGKVILRKMLEKFIPSTLCSRVKMGFSVPLDIWLRTSLRDWAENLLDEQRLRKEGFFNVTTIHRYWKEHLDGHCNWQHKLWNILMFQAWLCHWEAKLAQRRLP